MRFAGGEDMERRLAQEGYQGVLSQAAIDNGAYHVKEPEINDDDVSMNRTIHRSNLDVSQVGNDDARLSAHGPLNINTQKSEVNYDLPPRQTNTSAGRRPNRSRKKSTSDVSKAKTVGRKTVTRTNTNDGKSMASKKSTRFNRFGKESSGAAGATGGAEAKSELRRS